MAHYAKVLDGKVVNVIVAEPDFFKSFVDDSPGKWIQTSYNTRFGKHYDFSHSTEEITDSNHPLTKEDSGSPLRGNYAGIGSLYDYEGDYFYEARPVDRTGTLCESWTFDKTDYRWKPPIPYPPNPADGKIYEWQESTKSWIET